MSDETLKVCPFCAKLPKITIDVENVSGLIRYNGKVFCDDIMCHVHPKCSFSDTSIQTVVKMITDNWNTRLAYDVPKKDASKSKEPKCTTCAYAEFSPDGCYCQILGEFVCTKLMGDCKHYSTVKKICENCSCADHTQGEGLWCTKLDHWARSEFLDGLCEFFE